MEAYFEIKFTSPEQDLDFWSQLAEGLCDNKRGAWTNVINQVRAVRRLHLKPGREKATSFKSQLTAGGFFLICSQKSVNSY